MDALGIAVNFSPHFRQIWSSPIRFLHTSILILRVHLLFLRLFAKGCGSCFGGLHSSPKQCCQNQPSPKLDIAATAISKMFTRPNKATQSPHALAGNGHPLKLHLPLTMIREFSKVNTFGKGVTGLLRAYYISAKLSYFLRRLSNTSKLVCSSKLFLSCSGKIYLVLFALFEKWRILFNSWTF